jgi:hypothetical protein
MQGQRQGLKCPNFEKIQIHPEKGVTWERILEIKGVHLPLTRVNVASPTKFRIYPSFYIRVKTFCNHFKFYQNRHQKTAHSILKKSGKNKTRLRLSKSTC